MGAGFQEEVLAFEPGHLRQAQARLYGYQEKRVVASTKPGVPVRGGEQGFDFQGCEK